MRTMTFALAASLLTLVACGDKDPSEDDSGRAATASCEDEAYQDCLDGGNEDEPCRERAEEACEERADDTGRDDTGCEEVATRAYEECIDAGGEDDDCRERAAAAYDDCADDTGRDDTGRDDTGRDGS